MAATSTLALADLPAWLEAKAEKLRSADLSKPLKTIRLLLISATKRNFANGSSPDGVPWEPLKYRKGLPLRDTDILMASVTAGGADSIDELSGSGLRFGTSLDYAGPQNWGATISYPERTRPHGVKPWAFPGPDGRLIFTRRIRAHTVTIPARPFLGVTDELQQRINDVVRKYFEGLLK